MVRLALTLYSIIATTLAGSFMVVSLVVGYDTLVPIAIAAGLGFVLGIPAALFVARALQ